MIITLQNKYKIAISLTRGKSITITIRNNVAWYEYLRGLLDFLWIGDVDGDYLVSRFYDKRKIEIINKDFSGNTIPGDSTSKFKLQKDLDFISDDTDNLWFTSGGEQKEVSVQDLISGDYRTVVEYSNTNPYDVTKIGLLRRDAVLNLNRVSKLSHDFWLWFYWSGILNDNGYVKDNRLLP